MPKVKVNIGPRRRRTTERIRLPFPADPKLRIAQLSPAPRFASVELFAPKEWAELETFQPRVLLGRAADLQKLAEKVETGGLDLGCVDLAIVVLTRYGTHPVTDVLRVSLWQRFGVPLFELYLGPDDSLLASECAAHEGWHLEPGTQFGVLNDELILDSHGSFGLRTGLTGSFEAAPCPCGNSTTRLLDVEVIRRRIPPGRELAPRRFAASA
jgi:hypothetical protein